MAGLLSRFDRSAGPVDQSPSPFLVPTLIRGERGNSTDDPFSSRSSRNANSLGKAIVPDPGTSSQNHSSQTRSRQVPEEWLDRAQTLTLLEPYDTLVQAPANAELVDNLLIENSIVDLVSRPGAGKTWLAVDLAMRIATGQPDFLGFPIRVHGPVVYVVGEGRGRFKYRTIGFQQAHGITGSVPFFWHNGPINLSDPLEIAPFIDEIKILKPVLVVVDTLARCMPDNENDTQAMGQVVRSVDEIRASGATVLVLHHLNASGTRERGNTSLKGAVDTQFRIDEPSHGRITLTIEKQKDLDYPERPFQIDRRVIELDGYLRDNGEPVTSCVLQLAEETASNPVDSKFHGADRQIMRYLQTHPGISKTKLASKVTGKHADILKRIDDLVNKGLIKALPNGRTFVLRVAEQPLFSQAA